MALKLRSTDVFINCPLLQAIFDATIFAIYDLAFVARCALEVDDASHNRLDKILELIEQCRYGIHDISFVVIDSNTGLPRFNMPMELGLSLEGLPNSRQRQISIPQFHFRHRRAGHP